MPPPAPPADFAAAVRRHQAGDLDAAEAAYRRILAADPAHADALHLLGVVDLQRGRHADALERIGRAIPLAPGVAAYRNNLGVALRALGRLDEAAAAYLEAHRLDPADPDALANLGVALHDLGRAAEARPPLEAALARDPGHVDALFALANLLLTAGAAERAIPLLERAHAHAPGRADVLNNLAVARQAAGRHREGLDAFARAAAADPRDAEARANLAEALARQDRVEEAAEAFAAAARLRPADHHWPVRIAALCPAVFPDAAAIDRHRVGLEAVLDAHRAGLPLDNAAAAFASGCRPSFNLAHHGRDCRALKAKFAALFRDAFPAAAPAAPRDGGPPRIGFLATHPHEGMFLRCTAGVIDRLDPARFRVTVFGSPRGLPAMRAAIRRPDAEFIAIPDRLPEAAARVAAARCAVLYHWQVGSDPLNYFLPFARPAPIQCTSWGTHVTSGVPAVDYYLSAGLIEPPGSEAYYTEALVRLATLPTYQDPIPRPDPPPRRAEFGLPEGKHLYACLQRLAKFHPDFDPLLAGVLRRDPAGLVLLQEDHAPHATGRLRARLAATMPDVAGRVLFLPRTPRAAYLRLLALADVALDPIHYGSGATAYDILGLGLPLVTLPGALHVGRYAAGCYRKLGLGGLVAESPGAYVEAATRLGTDRDHRAAWSARIAAAAPALFEDLEAIREHERFFARVAASPA